MLAKLAPIYVHVINKTEHDNLDMQIFYYIRDLLARCVGGCGPMKIVDIQDRQFIRLRTLGEG
jgi:hypothetical protein